MTRMHGEYDEVLSVSREDDCPMILHRGRIVISIGASYEYAKIGLSDSQALEVARWLIELAGEVK